MLGALDIQRLTIKHKVLLAAFLLLGVFTFSSGRAHAATITVATGTDETTTNSSCSLSEAIANISDQAQNNTDCIAGDGNNDTINIPAGTVTLTTTLPSITVPMDINGAGMGQTIINGDNGQYRGFYVEDATSVSFLGITVADFDNGAFLIHDTSVSFSSIEVDGGGILNTGTVGIAVLEEIPGSYTVDAENVYIHNIDAAGGGYVMGFAVTGEEGTTIDVNMENTTLADVHNDGPGINGIIMFAGQGSGDGGTLTASIINTTVNDITSTGLTAPFAGFASVVSGASTDPSVTMTIDNITITGTRGVAGTGFTAGLDTAAFYAAGLAANSSGVANVDITVSNSLMADNLSDGVSSNCSHGDLSPNVGGLGTVNTTITSAGHNLSDDNTCVGFNQTGDRQSLGNIVSTLGPLQDNGGTVPTMALLAGSPAIGAGGAVLGISTDARGIARTNGWDVGAYQSNLGASTDTPSGSNGGAGNLADTGQNTKTSIFAGIALISAATALTLAQRRMVYKRR